MSSDAFLNSSECRKERIAALFDGDLSASEQRDVEQHVKTCGVCSEYLNSLKLVSSSLEIFLDKEPVQIPEEFSKRVTAAAESNLDGVRSRKERSRAVLICAFLFGISAIAITVSATGIGPNLKQLPGQIFALVGFVGHFFYTIATGFSVIFGTVCSRVFFGSTVAVIAIFGILFFSILVFSKHMTRFDRS